MYTVSVQNSQLHFRRKGNYLNRKFSKTFKISKETFPFYNTSCVKRPPVQCNIVIGGVADEAMLNKVYMSKNIY